MDYSRWALSRVDELERRVSQLSESAKSETVDSLEVLVEGENEYVSASRTWQINFPAFIPAENQNMSVVACLQAKYEFASTYKFSLVLDGDVVKSQNISATEQSEIDFFAVKRISCYANKEVVVGILIESDGPIDLTILSYSLNVIGKCKTAGAGDCYGRTSLDFFDPNSEFLPVEAETQEVVLKKSADETYAASAAVKSL